MDTSRSLKPSEDQVRTLFEVASGDVICSIAVSWLPVLYAAEKLDRENRESFVAHLITCEACGAAAARACTAIDSLGHLNVAIYADRARREAEGRVFGAVVKGAAPGVLELGQIYATLTGPTGDIDRRLVAVVHPGEATAKSGVGHVLVAPISRDVQFAAEGDVVVPEALSPLGFSFIVEVWQATSIPEAVLGPYFGALSRELRRALYTVWAVRIGVADRRGLSALRAKGFVGEPVAAHDRARLAFQTREMHTNEYLRQALTGAPTGLEDDAATRPATRGVDWKKVANWAAHLFSRASEVVPAVEFQGTPKPVEWQTPAATLRFTFLGEEMEMWLGVRRPPEGLKRILMRVVLSQSRSKRPTFQQFVVVQCERKECEGSLLLPLRPVSRTWTPSVEAQVPRDLSGDDLDLLRESFRAAERDSATLRAWRAWYHDVAPQLSDRRIATGLARLLGSSGAKKTPKRRR